MMKMLIVNQMSKMNVKVGSNMTLFKNLLTVVGVALAAVLTMSFASTSFAEEAPAPQAKKKKSTEVSFDDVLVQGKYHFSDEAVTTVEDDKILDALLGVRTDFKDRIKKSTARQ